MPESPISRPDGNSLSINRLAPGVFYHQAAQAEENPTNRGDIGNVSFVIGDRCVAVIDTGGSPVVGQRLLAAIRAKSTLPICYVINTHMHPDHVFGNRAFVDTKAVFVAGTRFPRALTARARTYLDRMNEILDQKADKSWIVLPDRTVNADTTLELGGRTLRIKAWPPAHTDNDLTVYDSRSQTLWLGDLLFVDRVPSIDASITGWIEALEHLKTRDDIAHAVPGHGPASDDWPAVLNKEYDYLVDIRDGVQQMLDDGRSLRYATRHVAMDQKSDWLLFDSYHARNVTAAFTELEWQ
ncbi:quinoprotein relay system zinc metallohydrolase 2 [Salinisphaera aquimarina]|uniref:Quinoprotein relay system zinc metallohydrolase 2 n=1 Tax=Salinisphaera aquimarina TaxID=2094031 RepID=A0ABV7EUP0_9GAMM